MKNYFLVIASMVMILIPALWVDASIQKHSEQNPTVQTVRGFHDQAADRLKVLGERLSNLKNRNNSIIKKNHQSFLAELSKLDGQYQSVAKSVDTLPSQTPHHFKEAKNQVDTGLKQLEARISQVQDDYSEKNLGLAELLGM